MLEHYRIIFDVMGDDIWNRKRLWARVRGRMLHREMESAVDQMIERDEIVEPQRGQLQIRAGIVPYHIRQQPTGGGQVAGPREITNSRMTQRLTGSTPVLRPGAEDFMRCPSRRGRLLYYRDGRVERMEG